MRRTFILLALLVAAAHTRALAQDKPVQFNIGGGVTFPVGDVADTFDTGWNFAAGLTFNTNEVVGFQAEYQFHRFGGPERLFDDVINPGGQRILIESNQQMHVGTFNVVLRAGGTSGVRAYLLAGPGVYNRKVQLTTPTTGVITVCDPYWLICYPTAVSTDAIIGDRSATDFGINVGGGVNFGAFYAEARYHYVWGSDITPAGGAGGQSYSTNASYFPITFGFRF